MSIRTTVHESLPYIDPEPTPAERAAAESLIASELRDTSPPTLPLPQEQPTFSPLITAELTRVASKQPLRAIDLSRYEAPDSSSSPTPTSPSTSSPSALARAHTAHAYLTARHAHLRLLDAYGRNAWLVGNWQLEAELARLERELAAARRDVDLVNLRRRGAQNDAAAGAELRGLEDAWRRGVGRVLETEVAAEALRQEVLRRRREGEGERGGG
ncbi:Pre-mRNA-splicing factor SPF27 [Xylariaceae sp. FL0662B]|nr:Pre-mRNA-splicing factor SPF27 [Xylariaceae sp. FL0662B]